MFSASGVPPTTSAKVGGILVNMEGWVGLAQNEAEDPNEVEWSKGLW